MTDCKYWNESWGPSFAGRCSAPDDVKTNATNSVCLSYETCPYLKSQMTKMTAEMFGANTPIVPDETVAQWMKDEPVKKMTEKELIQKQIEELQEKLEELENQKSLVEIAFKDNYGVYPDELKSNDDFNCWVSFKRGYIAAKKEKVSEYQPSMINCILEGNPPDGYVTWNEWYNELGFKGILHNLRISSTEHKKVEEVKKLQEKNWYDDAKSLLKPETLYDVLNKLERPMIVDDVCKVVEEWLPKEQSAAGSQNVYVECTVDGFNDCLQKIKSRLR